jgi:Ricin-type beta-trefoil lectin domain
MILWDCHGASNQLWSYTAAQELRTADNKCLDALRLGRTNGTSLITWSCSGGDNQKWNLNPNGTITGVDSGLCVDAASQGTANGTVVHLWACNAGPNQQWTLK